MENRFSRGSTVYPYHIPQTGLSRLESVLKRCVGSGKAVIVRDDPVRAHAHAHRHNLLTTRHRFPLSLPRRPR